MMEGGYANELYIIYYLVTHKPSLLKMPKGFNGLGLWLFGISQFLSPN